MGTFMLIGLGVWLHAADTLVTATLAPSIVESLGGVAYINWTIALYEVGAIIAGAAAGALSLHFGLRRVFGASALIYTAGCVGAAVATNIPILLAGRLIQGFGGGMLLSLCYLAIQIWYPPGARARLFGIVAAIWGGGSLLGPLIGGAFAGPHTWRDAFWLFAAQGLALAILAFYALPREIPADRARASWPFLPLIALTAATLLIAQAGVCTQPWLALAGIVGGVTLLYAAARMDQRAEARLLPSQSLSLSHPVGTGLLMVFAFCVGTTGFWAYGPLIVSVLFGTKPLVTGFMLAGEALAWSLATLAISSVPEEGERVLIRSGAAIITAGATGFAFVVPQGSLAGMVACALMQGAGFGICWPAIINRTVRSAPDAEQSLASAAVSTVQRVGYAVGTAAAGVAANLSGLGQGISIPAAKAAGFWVFAAFVPSLIVGTAAAWRFTRVEAKAATVSR